MRNLLRIALTAALCSAGCTTLPAATYHMSVFGTVTSVSGGPVAAQAGDPITLTALVDTSVPDAESDPTLGAYLASVSNLAFSFGGVLGTGSVGDAVVADNFAAFTDLLDFSATTPSGNVQIQFRNSNSLMLLTSDSLQAAITGGNLLQFPERFFDLTSTPGFADIRGRVDEIQFHEVPEPASCSLLLVAGATGLVLRRRRP
jgi:hypothetical protein